jgi:hypothetical protein
MIYKPTKNYGGWLGLIIGLIVFTFVIWGINYSLDESDSTLRTLLLIPTYLFVLIYSWLLLGSFYIRYKVEKDALVILWGMHKKIINWGLIDEIIEVKGETNFFPFLAMSWPGYMIGLYSAKILGSFRMYATDAKEGFIYLKTRNGLFGITPADPKFIDTILEKTGKGLTIIDMDQIPPEEKGESLDNDRFFNLYYKLNIIFLAIYMGYLGVFFPGSGAPKFIILLLVLSVALFAFNVSNAKRLFQFSSQGAYATLLVGLCVTGILVLLSMSEIGFGF